MTGIFANIIKAIAFVGEEIAGFFMVSKFAAPVFVVGVMAIFASPVLISRFF